MSLLINRKLQKIIFNSARSISKLKKRKILQDESSFEVYRMKPKTCTTHNKIYVWGMQETGALGLATSLKVHKHGLTTMKKFPKRMPFGERFEVIDAAAGYGFSVFAVEPTEEHGNYTLYGTGLNTDSQIGYHKHLGKTNKPIELLLYPAPIELPMKSPDEIHRAIKVECGRAHTVVLTEQGVVFTLGNNSYGQCARPIIEDENYLGSQVINRLSSELFGGKRIKDIACGQDHTMFLTEYGEVYSCGWSADGQTGLGTYNNQELPKLVEGDIKNEKIIKLSSTGDAVLAMNENGEVFGWGNSEYNQILLDSDEQQINVPLHLKYLKNNGKVIDIAAGGSFSMILNDEGNVFVWGYGLLGFGPNVDFCKEPKLIPPTLFGRNSFNPENRVTSINCGLYHMAAINSDNDLFMWGRNKFGCLGIGHDNDQYFPFKSLVGAKVHRVFCGVDHSIALCKLFI
ncbi:RCC1-like G exchanging factor-like protein [Chironomus tepperi]|uniref:RCC1-like G exchanging factor-like protein n=1 Tax=Chironomus tepperi TaxID=113505 RepID=UPI00391F4498